MTSSLLTNRCAPLINRTRSCSLYTATIIPWLQPLHGVISSQDAPISSALYLSILSCFYARTRDLPHVLAGMLFECKRVDVEIGLFAFVFIAIDKSTISFHCGLPVQYRSLMSIQLWHPQWCQNILTCILERFAV